MIIFLIIPPAKAMDPKDSGYHLEPMRGEFHVYQSCLACAHNYQEFIYRPQKNIGIVKSNCFLSHVLDCAPQKITSLIKKISKKQLSLMQTPHGLLLTGESGVGKTQLACALMTFLANSGWNHRYIDCGLIGFGQIGRDKELKRIVEPLLRSNQNSVVVLNDIESFFSKKDYPALDQNIKTAAIFTDLLKKNEIEKKIFFIATTKKPEQLIQLVTNFFQNHQLSMPDEESCLKTVLYHLKSESARVTSESLEDISKFLQGKNYFDITSDVDFAIQNAYGPAGFGHIDDAILLNAFSKKNENDNTSSPINNLFDDIPWKKIKKLILQNVFIFCLLRCISLYYFNNQAINQINFLQNLLQQKNDIISSYYDMVVDLQKRLSISA